MAIQKPFTFHWPAAAIHDTAAAIFRQSRYYRSFRESLLERLLRWAGEWWDRLMDSVRRVPHGRYVAIGVTLVLAALVVARIVYAARLRAEVPDVPQRHRQRESVAAADWEEAQRLAAAGRYLDAAHALYRTLLHALAIRERLRIHPSKTSGDYARELRARGSSSYAPFRNFGRRYDAILFGTMSCDASEYELLLRDALPILGQQRAA